ncbi:ABC-type multidrug transport system, ATPase component [Chthonomonas calidirosea]|uniref:ABC transporter ATP-binding protein n=1 Tax=Chthonomonas calidirosea TaxID=454171 RepID=UPI0006DD55BE|nr:ABC transporter ATP-binding protein [Chthonomonas calidirosea]CEK16107.1 ABC-type multidrug transport system, ATPase component [Chthonomonas calidirosea]CEK16109.1 ABC-type multidrug transport system, ATPase component [Chthonomonas calidirosea]
MNEYAIETVGLCKRFGRFEAVRSLDLQIPRGEVFGLLGPNGAGKTTSILMLLGNIRPTDGHGFLLGKPLGNIEVRKHVGFLPEKFQFHDFLTATEFLDLHGKLAGMNASDRARRIPEVLRQVGLAERAHTRIRELSKGLQQRIGLAQAMLHKPQLIVLDEPTSALDPLGRREVRDIILQLRNEGCTVLLNSHLLSEIEMTCNRVAIMKRGEVVAQGPIEELLAFSSVVEIEVADMNDAAMQALRQVATRLKFESVPPRKILAWVPSEADVPELARAVVCNNAKLLALVPKRETLEELFLRIVAENESAVKK